MSTLRVLEGVAVAEFGDLHAASVAAYHLRLAGAAVSLVEPAEGCELRRMAGRGRSGLFAFAGRGRTTVPLEGFGTEAPDVLFLPAYPDAALEDACARWRRDWDRTLFVDFREADGTQMTELTAQAECGITAFLGRAGSAPLRVGFEMVGHSAGLLAVAAVLAALRARADGPGQHIRVPFSRAAAAILNNVTTASVAPDQATHFSQGWMHEPCEGVPAADGAVELLFYGPGGAAAWPVFCNAIGAAAVAEDGRFDTHAGRLDHPAALADALAPWSSALPAEALVAAVRRAGGMAMAKVGVAGAAGSAQTRANGFVDAGSGLPAAPWSLDGVRACL